MSGDSLAVLGGAGGDIACMEDLDLLAEKLELAKDRVREADAAAATAGRVIFDAQASLFPPGAWLRLGPGRGDLGPLEQAVLASLRRPAAEITRVAGPGGIEGLATELEELANRVRIAKAGYEEAERAAQDQVSSWDSLRAVELSHTAWFVPGGFALAGAKLLVNAFFGAGDLTVELGRAPSWAELLRRHNGEVRAVAGSLLGLPGLVSTPSTGALTTRLTVIGNRITVLERGDLGRLLVTRGATRRDLPADGVAGLVGRITAVADSRREGTGKIGLSKVTAPNGSVSWLVSIPGTMDATSIGWSTNPEDLKTNFEAVAGQPSAISLAVMAAMKDAGVKKGQPVVLTGHSQGGLVSAQLASNSDFNRAYTVAGIATFGSPVSQMKPPRGQQWLSLEHAQDPIPALAPPNERGTGHVTVTRDLSQADDPAIREGSPHSKPVYADTAKLVDQSDEASIEAWRRAVAPVLDPKATVTTTEYEAERVFEDGNKDG